MPLPRSPPAPTGRPAADPRSNEKAAREVLSLKAYVFRALRYIFSVERNRKARGPCGGGAVRYRPLAAQ